MAAQVWDPTQGWVDATAAGFTPSPLTTKGDLWGYSTGDARVPVGADNTVLTADSTQALGVKWAASGASGVSDVDGISGSVTLVAGTNVTITDNSPAAGNITIAASGGGGGGLVLLSETTLGAANANIDTGAGGVAGGHDDLVVTFNLVGTAAVVAFNPLITFNADTAAHYDTALIRNFAGAVAASNNHAQTALVGMIAAPGASVTAGYVGTSSIQIPKYDQTTFFKACVGLSSPATDVTANDRIVFASGAWRSTAAITQITVNAGSGTTFAAGSSMSVYGTQ